MATVWRVQNASGQGPYMSADVESWAHDLRRHNSLACPTPAEDRVPREGLAYLGGQGLCGFASKAAALEWFTPDELKALESEGFRLVEVQAYDGKVWYGRKQCVFIPAPMPAISTPNNEGTL